MSVSTELRKILKTIDGNFNDQLAAINAEDRSHEAFQTQVANFIRLETQNKQYFQNAEANAHEKFQQLLMKPASSQSAQRVMDVLQFHDRPAAPSIRSVNYLVVSDTNVLESFPERYVLKQEKLAKLTAQYTGGLFANPTLQSNDTTGNYEQTMTYSR